jgi:hypothetical protein
MQNLDPNRERDLVFGPLQRALSACGSTLMAKRTSFYFPPEAARWLRAIKCKCRLENSADVIRAALSAYDDLLRIDSDGYDVIVRDDEGKERTYSPYAPFEHPKLQFNKLDEAGGGDNDKPPRNFVFSREASERLESIRRRSYLQSNAEVIRAALCAYNELLVIRSARYAMIIRDREGNEWHYSPHTPLSALNPIRKQPVDPTERLRGALVTVD